VAARKRQEALDVRYADATKSAEELAAAWDFRGAAVELNKVRFEEAELAARLTQRRAELKRMYGLKQKLIAAINAAQSPLKKSSLGIKGLGGDVTKADEAGLTCKLINGKSESLVWSDLGVKALPKLLPLGMDCASPDDWLAAALIALACRDAPMAEKCFEQARSLGANVDRYLTPLAEAAFARAKDLLDKKLFTAVETAIEDLETKYATIPWFRANQKTVRDLRETAKREALDAEAEKLYTSAAESFGRKDLYELKPLVERLKADYGNTRPVADGVRKPSIAEMDKAVAKLGRRITVRLDGKGHFRSIQAAVKSANVGDLVEIEDNGPYSESVVISSEKSGITLRGKRGAWPLLISMEPNSVVGPLIGVNGPNTTIQQMVLVNLGAPGRTPQCLSCDAAGVKVARVIAAMPGSHVVWSEAGTEFDNCLLVGPAGLGRARLRNSIISSCRLTTACVLQTCTIQSAGVEQPAAVFSDCVIGDLGNRDRVLGHRMDHCLTFGNIASDIERGPGCLSANPMFRDPTNLDYRLQPGSPCIGKASDGGDIGCRYTPEMIELCKVALELRRRGIIKF
jgi:hypothetical protein